MIAALLINFFKVPSTIWKTLYMLLLHWSPNERAEEEASPAELLWHLFTTHFQAQSLRGTNQNWIQKGLLEPGEKCIQMGFLLDWLHFPTLEWYRSAGSLCPPTAADRFQTPFLSLHSGKLSRVSILHGAWCEIWLRGQLFHYKNVPLIIDGFRKKDFEITRILALFGWTPCIPNREGKAISARRSRRKRRRRRRHIL